MIARLAGLISVVLVSGCTGLATTRPAPLAAWTQWGPQGLEVRAVVGSATQCPDLSVDGAVRPMRVRAEPSSEPIVSDNRAFAAKFDVRSCTASVPVGAKLSLGDQSLPMAGKSVRRIVMLGDTGCRLKVPATGKADPVQDCTDPAAWPWRELAKTAAGLQPDLVIHVGDYHYREQCDDPVRCAALLAKGVQPDYGWGGWDADFFEPATSLLAAAPWVMVRGNHENCDRAGEGWMRFLAPAPYAPCGNQRYRTASRSNLRNNHTAEAFRVDLDGLSLIVADNAAHEDYRHWSAAPDDLAVLVEKLQAARRGAAETKVQGSAWLLSHRPLWYDMIAPPTQPNGFQSAVRQTIGAEVQMVVSGHQHNFQTLEFAPGGDSGYSSGRPAQMVVGGGGTQLEASDPASPFYEGLAPGSRERSRPDGQSYEGVAASAGVLINRFSFVVLDRVAAGWDLRVLDPKGQEITRCRLGDGTKVLGCAPAERIQ